MSIKWLDECLSYGAEDAVPIHSLCSILYVLLGPCYREVAGRLLEGNQRNLLRNRIFLRTKLCNYSSLLTLTTPTGYPVRVNSWRFEMARKARKLQRANVSPSADDRGPNHLSSLPPELLQEIVAWVRALGPWSLWIAYISSTIFDSYKSSAANRVSIPCLLSLKSSETWLNQFCSRESRLVVLQLGYARGQISWKP